VGEVGENDVSTHNLILLSVD